MLVKCTSLIWVLLFPVTSVFRGCPELKGSVQKLSLSFLAFGNGERGTRQLQIGSEIRGKMANNPMRDGQPAYEVPRAEKRVKMRVAVQCLSDTMTLLGRSDVLS